MRYTVIITDPARDQLLEIARWWAENRSGEQAIRWYDGFCDALQSLTNSPEKHRLARENALFKDELRELYYGLSRRTHRAIFRIDGDVVRVVAVRHLAQDDIRPGGLE
jgi:plasmid stabilization system protein ParE